jgi:hypothetical protein
MADGRVDKASEVDYSGYTTKELKKNIAIYQSMEDEGQFSINDCLAKDFMQIELDKREGK